MKVMPIVGLVLALSVAPPIPGTSFGDAEDPCPSPAPPLVDATLVIRGFATIAADDAFRLTGTLTPSVPMDPSVSGFSVLIENEFVGPVVQANVGGGVGWRPRPRGGWLYRDPRGVAGGIVRIALKPLAGGTLGLRIDGRRGGYAESTDIVPLHASVALALPPDGAGRCGDAYLSLSRCSFASAGDPLRCTAPPPSRRCTSSHADALVRCDVQNGVAAQETYFAAHGSYFSGDCGALPGFTLSPGVVCATVGNDIGFSLVTTAPTASIACVYDSLPGRGEPNLVCS